jgi:hypothetical protein
VPATANPCEDFADNGTREQEQNDNGSNTQAMDVEDNIHVNNEKERAATAINVNDNHVEDNNLLEEESTDVEARDVSRERAEDCILLEIVTAIINDLITVTTTGSEHVPEVKNNNSTLEKEVTVEVQVQHAPPPLPHVEEHNQFQSTAGKDQFLVEASEKWTVDKLKELLLQAKLQEKEGKKNLRRLMVTNKNE